MQKEFVQGNDKVSLSDVMIDMQKANISFQATVQVRNKVIAAYNDIQVFAIGVGLYGASVMSLPVLSTQGFLFCSPSVSNTKTLLTSL